MARRGGRVTVPKGSGGRVGTSKFARRGKIKGTPRVTNKSNAQPNRTRGGTGVVLAGTGNARASNQWYGTKGR